MVYCCGWACYGRCYGGFVDGIMLLVRAWIFTWQDKGGYRRQHYARVNCRLLGPSFGGLDAKFTFTQMENWNKALRSRVYSQFSYAGLRDHDQVYPQTKYP